MKQIIEYINNTIQVVTFDEPATNYEDAREGSALAMVKWANHSKVGGYDDWVLPTRETLIDLYQLLDKDNSRYWSSSPFVGYSGYAWYVYFNSGNVYGSGDLRSSGYYVRLVRASQLYEIGLAALNKRFGK